jgi:hypothetical protein
VEYVASFYDGHRFGDIVKELTPWQEQIIKEPRLFRFLTRVKVFNTLGRAQVILALPGWEENLQRSLALQQKLDPANVPRTICNLSYGLLRHHRPEDARRAIESFGPLDLVANSYSRGSLAYLCAEAVRQQGISWSYGQMEELDCWDDGNPPPHHVFAFYMQAVARQRGCPDSARRFRRAAELCRPEVGGGSGNITSLFALFFDLAAAAADNDDTGWLAARSGIEVYLKAHRSVYDYYGATVAELPPMPKWAAAEALLDRTPYL